MSKSKITVDDAVNAVILLSIQRDEPVTAKEVAEHLGAVTVSTVRRLLDAAFDTDRGWTRITKKQGHVATYSRSYPGMEHGVTRTNLYEVTKTYLCRIVRGEVTNPLTNQEN